MNPHGRPTAFRPDYCIVAREHCLLGATNAELAEALDVAPRTVDNWIAGHPEFAAAVREGRRHADARVASSLYARATGWQHTVERRLVCRGEVHTVEVTVKYPPDTQACIFWLRNRARQTWREAPNAATADDGIDDIARLEAASESVRRRADDHRAGD